MCAAWAGHPSLGAELTVDDFLKHPHLTFNISDPWQISIADDHAARLGRERRIVASTASFTAAPFLLSGTPLLAIVPRRLGERMRVAADLRLLELPFSIPPLRDTLA